MDDDKNSVSTAVGPAVVHRLQVIGALTVRDLKVNYDRSFLGFAWTLAAPLLQLGVLYVVFELILGLGGPNYPAYVFIGLLAYGWFQSATLASCWATMRSPELLLRPGFPRWVLPLIPVAVGAVHFLLALPLAFVIALLFGASIGPGLGWLPAIVVLQLAITAPIAFIAAALNSHYRDVYQVMQLLTLLLFFLTPVFYSRSDIPPELGWIAAVNPLSYVTEAYRAAMLGTPWPPITFMYSGLAVALVGLPLAVWMYSRMSARFVEDI